MFASVLIANRGEIACRIIRTARALGMRAIAVHSHADRAARHVRLADEAVAIGGSRPQESYLNAHAVLEAARSSGAACLHPGYGFLAENAGFAEACAVAGVNFIGPPPAAIRAMGRKDEAKAMMAGAGIPVVPGYDGAAQDPETLAGAAARIGYPVMIKAVAGGGGTGMRRVDGPEALHEALEGARREAGAAFGDSRVMIEKCLDRPRHVEVQILADAHGNCVHLFERDCSLQRRHQKVIEEAPAPGMAEALRAAMSEAAVRAARVAGYTGAGTVEFLVDGVALSPASPFYFLEMNTRLQVEHPVTEEVTGIDLVEWQFRLAAGEPLGFAQEDIRLDGHAVEARLYAEDPFHGFLPSAGRLHLARWPEGEGIRVETGVESGDSVSPYYDPMLAKVIARGRSRDEALGRLRGALERTAVAGPRTNLAFLHDLLGRADVAAGRIDTGLIARGWTPAAGSAADPAAIRAGLRALLEAKRERTKRDRIRFSNEARSPWAAADGFTLSTPRSVPLAAGVDGVPVAARVTWGRQGPEISVPAPEGCGRAEGGEEWCEVVVADGRAFVLRGLRQWEVSLAAASGADQASEAGGGVLRAPMHGRIVRVHARAGDRVERGARLAVLEAMKMEHVMHAPFDGVVADLPVSEGEQVEAGAVVAVVEEDAEQP